MEGPGDEEPLLSEDGSINDTEGSSVYRLPESPKTRIYKRRWFILYMDSMICFVFGLAVSALPPIAHAVKEAYGWDNAAMALVNLWISLVFILTSTFFSWVLDTRGLRTAYLTSATALALGTGIRCITTIKSSLNWCLHLGTIVVGLSSTTVYGGCTTLSNIWFPPYQRTLATSLSNIGMTIGVGVGSLLSPLVVQVNDSISNTSSITLVNDIRSNGFSTFLLDYSSVGAYISGLRQSIGVVLYIQFGLALIVCLAMAVYFPSKPPSPPSVSASQGRTAFHKGIRGIFKRPKFWIIASVYALTVGTCSGLGSQLDVNLQAAKVPNDQIVSGTIGTSSIFSSVLACLIFSMLADRFRHKVKYLILFLLVIGLLCWTWFALIIQGIAPGNYPSLYISYITAWTAVMAPGPMYLELACDSVFPIAEGVTSGFVNILPCTATMCFLLIFMVPHIGTLWMNWLMVGCMAFCIPLISLFTPSPGRKLLDTKVYPSRQETGHEDGQNVIPPVY